MYVLASQLISVYFLCAQVSLLLLLGIRRHTPSQYFVLCLALLVQTPTQMVSTDSSALFTGLPILLASR